MKWIHVEDIAEALEEAYPEMDVLSLRFTMLRKLVLDLDGFEDEPSKCNEKILEVIQANWINIRKESI